MNDANGEILNEILAHLPGLPPSWMFGAFMIFSMIFRLLAERQRRITYVDILRHAPGGSVIIQPKSLFSPGMSIWVGHGMSDPPPDAVHLVVHPPQQQRALPAGGDR
ncbi:hypothetical protein [Actinoplanes sp. G11-F43]|uniref:hypothetical protein n=1 Tax=Actinoplanes sp. G11-F43 TaxID=3424130 RepID=UPI003D337EEC